MSGRSARDKHDLKDGKRNVDWKSHVMNSYSLVLNCMRTWTLPALTNNLQLSLI